MVGRCWSTAGVSARFAQSLVPLTSAGIIPVQDTVTVWPLLDGTVILLAGGVEAKLNMANTTPSAQRTKPIRVRRLKRPDSEEGAFFMMVRAAEYGRYF